MKAIVEYTDSEYAAMEAKMRALYEAVGGVAHKFDRITKQYGYAHYTFSCTVSEELIDALGRIPDTDEVIMLVDGGFSHFGATCQACGRSFNGRVNID